MENEATIRLAFFFGILVLVALGEFIFPRRTLMMARPIRWCPGARGRTKLNLRKYSKYYKIVGV